MKTTTDFQLVATDKLIPYVNNARTHSPEQIKKLRSSLREFGFKSSSGLTIQNDSMKNEEFYSFLLASFQCMAAHLEKGGAAYVFHADTEGLNFRRAFIDAGFHLAGCCIWVKDSLVLGRSDYQWQHEPVLYGFMQNGKHKWYSDRKQTTIWHFDKPNRKLFDVMTKGSGDARMQPLYFLITTAGTDTNSICYEQHQKAQDILEGRKIDKTFYPVIYGAPDDADWTSPEVWKNSNPSLGETIGMDKVEAACESAKQNPGEENAFRQLRLNQWVKQTVRWMPMHKWDACKVDFDESFLEGRVCYGGLDLSSTTDITAFVLVFPPTEEDDHYYILLYFWLPEETLDLRVRRDHVPYDLWERQGYLLTTEGNVVHYGFIENFIDELGTRFNIREIAFDRWGAVQMSQNL